MEQSATELDEREIEQLQSSALEADPRQSAASQVLHQLVASTAAAALSKSLTPAETTRAKRLAAIMSVHGIWKDDVSKPKDPVEYQRQMRAEW